MDKKYITGCPRDDIEHTGSPKNIKSERRDGYLLEEKFAFNKLIQN